MHNIYNNINQSGTTTVNTTRDSEHAVLVTGNFEHQSSQLPYHHHHHHHNHHHRRLRRSQRGDLKSLADIEMVGIENDRNVVRVHDLVATCV